MEKELKEKQKLSFELCLLELLKEFKILGETKENIVQSIFLEAAVDKPIDIKLHILRGR